MKTIIDDNIIHNDILKKIKKFNINNPDSKKEDGYLYYFFYNYELIGDDNMEMSNDELSDEIERLWNELTPEKKNKWFKYETDTPTCGSNMRKEIKSSQLIKNVFSALISEDKKMYEHLWISAIMYDNFIIKEKERYPKDDDLKKRILDFITTEIIQVATREREDWRDCVTHILELSNKEYTEDEAELKSSDDSIIESYVEKTIKLFLYQHAILSDLYLLLRIFKNFDMTDMEKAYTGSTDQPLSASNIIIYAGDLHSDRYRRFLKSIGNDPIEKTGNFTYDTKPTNCIDMSRITQPFFKIK